MTDSLHPLKPGEPIRAAMLNKLIDGAKIALDSQKSGGGAIPGFDVSNTVVRTRLQTDKPLPRYAVVSIEGALIDPDKNRNAFLQAPAIRAGKPNAETANFAILQHPASPNQVVPACVSGVSIVEINVGSAEHQFAIPNDSYTMTSAESGGAKILWKQDTPGNDGKTWALVSFPATVGGGTAPPSSERETVPVLIPASNGLAEKHAEKFELLKKDTETEEDTEENEEPKATSAYALNAVRMGIAKTGTQPLRVYTITNGNVVPKLDNDGNPLYYKDITWQCNTEGWHTFTEDKIEQAVMQTSDENLPDYTGWTSLAALYCYLNTITPATATLLAQTDYSDQWETTTNPQQAVCRDNLIIAPTHCPGYWTYPTVTYAPDHNKTYHWTTNALTTDESNITIPIRYCTAILPNQFSNQPFVGTLEETLFIITVDDAGDAAYNDEPTLEEFFNLKPNQTRFVKCEWQNDRPKVKSDVSIENTCADIPLLALGKQGNVPQIILCENIPYGYCIPLKKIECLTRVSKDDCAPMYSGYKYSVAVGTIDIQSMYQPLNVDWIPSLGSCTD